MIIRYIYLLIINEAPSTGQVPLRVLEGTVRKETVSVSTKFKFQKEEKS